MPSLSQTSPFTKKLHGREPERNYLRCLCLFHQHFPVIVQQLEASMQSTVYTSSASSSHQLLKFERINLCPPSPALVVDRAYQDRKTMLLCLWASGAIAGLQQSELGCSVWLQKNVTAGKLFPLSIWLTVGSLNAVSNCWLLAEQHHGSTNY